MNLYFVHAEIYEPNLDWFVVARTSEEALELWSAQEMVKDHLDSDTKVTVRRVPASPHHFIGTPKVIPWDEIEDVTP